MAQIVSSVDFQKEVLDSDKPVLVDFFATWCGPCKMLSPTIDELSTELKGTKVVKVDIDQSPDLAAMYEVQGVPTMILFNGGTPVVGTVGAQSKQAIIQMIEEFS